MHSIYFTSYILQHAGADFCSYQIVHLNITELSEQPECENFNEDFTDFLAHNRVGDEVGLSCEGLSLLKDSSIFLNCNLPAKLNL